MDQAALQKIVETNLDNQVGLDACWCLVSFGIDQIEARATPPKREGDPKPVKTAGEVKSEMTQEWLDTAKVLITEIGSETDLLYEIALNGPTGFTLFLVKNKTYKKYCEEIYSRIEEIKQELQNYVDRDENEWGGSPQETLDEFITELTMFVGSLHKKEPRSDQK